MSFFMFVPPKSNFYVKHFCRTNELVNFAKILLLNLCCSTEKHVFVKESVSETGLLNL